MNVHRQLRLTDPLDEPSDKCIKALAIGPATGNVEWGCAASKQIVFDSANVPKAGYQAQRGQAAIDSASNPIHLRVFGEEPKQQEDGEDAAENQGAKACDGAAVSDDRIDRVNAFQ